MKNYNFRFLFAGVCMLLTVAGYAQIPPHVWGHHVGGTGADHSRAMVTDAMGNVYITGDFQGSVDFDPAGDTASLTEQLGIYVLKFNMYGEFQWVKEFSGSEFGFAFMEGKGITIDTAGYLYITGYFQDTVDFDPGPSTFELVASGSSLDIFIVKLNMNDGSFVWAKRIGSTFNDVGNSITTDHQNIYVTGYFRGIVDFDPNSGVSDLTTVGNQDIFILKLDLDGNYIWAKNVGSTTADEGNSIALDSNNHLYVTGYFQLTADFDPGAGVTSLASAGGWDIFILKLFNDGSFSWAKRMGSPGADVGNGINIDGDGNIYTVGKFTDNVDFDPDPTAGAVFSLFGPGGDAFVQKLDATGTFIWARKFGGQTATAYLDEAKAVQFDEFNDVYVAGDFTSACNFDFVGTPVVINSNGATDGFVAKLNSAGSLQWAGSIGATANDEVASIALNEYGNIYASGNFTNGPVDLDMSAFGVDTVTSHGNLDFFILKLNQCFLAPGLPVDVTPIANLTYCEYNTTTLSATGTGIIYWFDSSTSSSIIGVGNNFTPPVLPPGTYTFYAEDSTCASSDLRTGITVNVLGCLSMHSEESITVAVYPNPFVNTITVSGLLPHSQILITDMLGKVLYKLTTENETETIDLQALSKGNYLLSMQSSNTFITKKIIKN
jgi:hypothetical protein